MKKHLARTLVAVALVGPWAAGCNRYRDRVDRCWPERYNKTARKSLVDAFAPQVQNGQVLDQTVWNYFFETGTDELNGYGRSKLDYMVRRRPEPDPNVFVQTAHDLPYDAAMPDKQAEVRRELDIKRVASVQRYLNAQTVGRPFRFELAIHDPFMVGANSSMARGNARFATAPTTTGVLSQGSGGDQGQAAGQQGAAQGQGQNAVYGAGSGSTTSGSGNTSGGSGSSNGGSSGATTGGGNP